MIEPIDDVTLARRSRKDKGTIRATERDLKLLSWIGEQYTIRIDQLERLMGRSSHTARWLRSRWHTAGWFEGRVLLVGQPVFLWLTREGQKAVGLEYKLWQPTITTLAHTAAVNDVRLHLETQRPDGIWTSERELRRQNDEAAHARKPHLPDGLWQITRDGEPRAIAVELTYKGEGRTATVMADLLRRYPRVIYFAPEPLKQRLATLAVARGWERISVLALPE